jgi:hypothetical protein
VALTIGIVGLPNVGKALDAGFPWLPTAAVNNIGIESLVGGRAASNAVVDESSGARRRPRSRGAVAESGPADSVHRKKARSCDSRDLVLCRRLG